MNIKSFSEQFRECKKNNLLKGTFYTFEENPGLIPPPYKRSALKMIKDIESGKLKGITLYKCGKFNNGICSSANKQCRKLRGCNG